MNKLLKKIKISTLNRAENLSKSHDFSSIFTKTRPTIIAEIKFSSPSSGKIYPGNRDHLTIAADYLKAGAAALSILTEPEYFGGNIKFIVEIREKFPDCFILQKDFILDKNQILQAKLIGADAILLIASFLSTEELSELYNFSLDCGLTPLIEIHTFEELNDVLPLSPKLLGINNRNLNTSEIDLETSRTLINQIPDGIFVISESGLQTAEQIYHFQKLGFDGFLMGSCFMRNEDPGLELANIICPSLRAQRGNPGLNPEDL